MNRSKTLITGLAALAGTVSSQAIAESGGSEVDQQVTTQEKLFSAFVTEIDKNGTLDAEKNPLPKEPIKPVVKNDVIFKGDGLESEDQTEFGLSEALYCLHLIKAQVNKNGVSPVLEDNISEMEDCLESFAESLLE